MIQNPATVISPDTTSVSKQNSARMVTNKDIDTRTDTRAFILDVATQLERFVRLF